MAARRGIFKTLRRTECGPEADGGIVTRLRNNRGRALAGVAASCDERGMSDHGGSRLR